jgi:hypothetical protein
MKISLRKANAIQQNINELIRVVKFETTATVNEFEPIELALDEANARLKTEMARAADLTEALYSIRVLVGTANSGEIDGYLTVLAANEKLINFYNIVLNSPKRVSLNVLQGKMDKIKARTESENAYMSTRSTEITTGILAEETIKEYKLKLLTLKKEKQKLQDKVLELNIKTEIELPESVVTILKREDLV